MTDDDAGKSGLTEKLHRSNLDFLQDSKLSFQPSSQHHNKNSSDPEESPDSESKGIDLSSDSPSIFIEIHTCILLTSKWTSWRMSRLDG